jgi:hypothetical protein
VILTLRPALTADASVLNAWSFAPGLDHSLLDTYRSAPYMDYSVYDTWLLFVACGFLHIHHLVPYADRGLLRAQHLCSVLGPSGNPYSVSTSEDLQVVRCRAGRAAPP